MSNIMQQHYPNSYRMLEACTSLHTDVYLYLDDEEEMVGCNKALLELLGFDNFEKLQAKKSTLSQLFVHEVGNPLPEMGQWKERLSKQRLSVRIRDKAGQIHRYQVYQQDVDFDASALHVLILHEITFYEKAQEAIRHYEEMTQDLLTSISRQFRTPLNSIVGFVGLLEHTDLDRAQRQYMTHVRDAAESITSTVDNLIEMMHAERGDLKEIGVFFDPMELYEPISSRYGELAQAKGISLLFMFDPGLPKELHGDAGKITRVMRNLIDNAIKFTGTGGQVYVEITCKEINNEHAHIEYSVADTGVGIKEEKLSTILKPFAVDKESDGKSKEGMGIGLNLSHKLLSILRSKLRVASKVGKGSRFSFGITHRISEPKRYELREKVRVALLVKQKEMVIQSKLLLSYLERFGADCKVIGEINDKDLDQVDILFILNANIKREKIELLKSRYTRLRLITVITQERFDELKGGGLGSDYDLLLPLLANKVYKALSMEPKMPLEELASEEVVVEQKRATILIAEDNPINQKLLTTLLGKFNYDTVVANNGQEAVNAYLHAPYDLVLMDIDMPIMDGITATRLIHEVDKTEGRIHTPVIALTAHALPGDKERLLKAGLDEHIAKPVDTAILLNMIKTNLEKRQKLADASV